MTTAILAGSAVVMTLVASKSTYPFLRFFAGALWWALGVWLIITPLVSGSSPINDIMVVLCFFGGFGVMLMMNWRNGTDKSEGGFNIRLPAIFGGISESSEIAMRQRNAMSARDRQANYRAKANAATRGRRMR